MVESVVAGVRYAVGDLVEAMFGARPFSWMLECQAGFASAVSSGFCVELHIPLDLIRSVCPI